jgi:molybdate transport system ATP-binding protein
MLTENADGLPQKAWLTMVAVEAPLKIERFSATANEVWCVYGDNRSGIERFVDQFRPMYKPSPSSETFDIPENLGIVSFKDQQEIFEREVRNDESDFLDRIDPGTPAREFIANLESNQRLIEQLRLGHVLDSGYRQLSSGESRKLLILKAISEGAVHLLIENPYDGLDIESCAEFDRIMKLLIDRGLAIMVVLSRFSDIPPWCTHLAWIEAGVMVESGSVGEVRGRIESKQNNGDWKLIIEDFQENNLGAGEVELIRLVDGHARYGERTIFSGFDFVVKQHQHTLISGPNGAGKSTLLGLVTGDHQDCYTNELYLFGNRRGSGESIWDIKKEMGIVSPALHREHYIPGNCLHIVVSGFFDSIGLYSKPTPYQLERAAAWLSVIGLASLQQKPFRTVSYGEQRLILIARALIKMPRLLVLDEPTHGIDDANRARLLDFLELIVERRISTIVYVSHRRDEFRDFFRQHVDFGRLTDNRDQA